jgi:hypothetical protein
VVPTAENDIRGTRRADGIDDRLIASALPVIGNSGDCAIKGSGCATEIVAGRATIANDRIGNRIGHVIAARSKGAFRSSRKWRDQRLIVTLEKDRRVALDGICNRDPEIDRIIRIHHARL